MSSASLQFYFWPTPNGKKIAIFLEEAALAYDIHPVDIGKGDQFKPEFLAISPNNKMPAMVDRDGPGGAPISVFESGAILQYLARKTGRFYGDDARAQVEVEQWLFWQVGGVGPMMGQAKHFKLHAPQSGVADEQLSYGAARYRAETLRLLGVAERRLSDRAYLAGAFSIADMATFPWIDGLDALDIDASDYPNIQAWCVRMHDRPAVARAMALKPKVGVVG